MRGLDVYQNLDVSDTKLMLCPRVCFNSSDLTVNKLFPINPRAVTGPPKMSLLLEVESTSAFIIEPRLILVTYKDDARSTSKERYSFKTSTGLSEDQMLRQGRSRMAPQTLFRLTWCFRKTFLLTHKLGTACAVEMTAESDE